MEHTKGKISKLVSKTELAKQYATDLAILLALHQKLALPKNIQNKIKWSKEQKAIKAALAEAEK